MKQLTTSNRFAARGAVAAAVAAAAAALAAAAVTHAAAPAHASLLAQAASAPAGADIFWIAAGLILLALGIVLGVLELFLPTGGLLAIATATCFIGSIAAFFAASTTWGFAALALYAAGTPVALVLGLQVWKRSPIARSMVLGTSEEEGAEDDGTAASAAGADARAMQALLGAHGVAVTPMRPVGFVRIGALRVEASAEMGMIESGTAVEVIEAGPARIVVRARG